MMSENASDRFFNRELSALEFNARVLAEARDPALPLLERLKFIGIVSSNLDEFFMVRGASFDPTDPILRRVLDKARQLIEEQNQHFVQEMVPALEAGGLIRLKWEALAPTQLDYVRTFFQKELLPVLTPIALPEERPVPALANLRLYMMVELASPASASAKQYAVIEIPSNFPRVVFLPAEKGHPFVLLEDVVSFFVKELFLGYDIVQQGLMRLTRAAEISWDEEKDEDFMKVMTEALRQRRQAAIVRLETSVTGEMAGFLKKKLDLGDEDLVRIPSWFDLKGISPLAFQPGFEELKRPAWEPKPVADFERNEDVWKILKEKNIVVLHPYESFDSVHRFISTAADDPDVLAIKQTLYRMGPNSPLTRSLERAAEKGKQVTVLIELKARFDEENNMEWARRLQMAGATVLYGVAGLKTHAKACLVVRREPEGIKRYVHLSTGNYNERTARLYSDIGFFSSQEDLANDLSAFFNMITGYSQPLSWTKIEVAPYGLRRKLLRLIKRESMRSSPERPGIIMAKMNSLSDPAMIEALYHASKAGVQIKLNVRGICCLRPGVKGLSDTIEVISIVDQFLEHSRIFYFFNGGEEEVFLSSADWMSRNLDRRIEMMFPIEDPDNKKKLLEVLKLYFRDNVKAWKLSPEGTYQKVEPGTKRKLRAQEVLCERTMEQFTQGSKIVLSDLRPQKATSTIPH